MHCIVLWGLSSAMISSLHNSLYPPEMDKNPLMMVCGGTCGGLLKDDHTCNRLILQHAFVNVLWHVLADSQSVQLGNAAATNRLHMVSAATFTEGKWGGGGVVWQIYCVILVAKTQPLCYHQREEGKEPFLFRMGTNLNGMELNT